MRSECKMKKKKICLRTTYFLVGQVVTAHTKNVRLSLYMFKGSDYGQTLRGEAFGPMKMQKMPKVHPLGLHTRG